MNMFSKTKKQLIILAILAVLLAGFSFAAAIPVHAGSDIAVQDMDSVKLAQYGLKKTADAAKLSQYGDADSLPRKIGKILFAILGFIGVIFLVITIYGGFLWMTAGGSAEQTKRAGTMIKNGAIGIIIIAVSYGITLFIFNNILGDTGTSQPQTCSQAGGTCTGACLNLNLGQFDCQPPNQICCQIGN